LFLLKAAFMLRSGSRDWGERMVRSVSHQLVAHLRRSVSSGSARI
jgi:hypothetical protein